MSKLTKEQIEGFKQEPRISGVFCIRFVYGMMCRFGVELKRGKK
jgi:hypothetical protein